jgi:glycosyltransferase involved in cell wall biosynthesis
MNDVIFISWQKHQRTQSFCEKLVIPLYEIISTKSGIARYIECFFATKNTLGKTKPKTLIIQNPSIVLAITAILLRPFYGYMLFMDAHNEAIHPFILNNAIIKYIAKIIIKKADLTIVTNNVLAQAVIEYGGKAFILPDLLPNVKPHSILTTTPCEPIVITLISTYAPDEPYQEVFTAMELVGDQYQLYVTGKIPSTIEQSQLPANVKLLGFLSHDNYWGQLYKSHIIIDLSTMENCLVCGAYEAMAIEKPLILSLNSASIELFGDFAIHTTNDARSIASAITKISNDYTAKAESLGTGKTNFLTQEKQRLNAFKQKLNRATEN